MTPFFASPLAFAAGGALVAALVAIYVLRNRLPSVEVSSLFLWAEAPKTKEGGRKIKRLALPLLFFLELAALVLLTIAAARPFLPLTSAAAPLVVVLDDSFSMRAGEPESPRDKALRFLAEDLDAGRVSSVQVILAGDAPALAGEAADDVRALAEIAPRWHCADARSDLRAAIALALETGGPRARILVVSDHAPEDTLSSPRLVWRAFGEPRDNLAFVSAVRSTRREGQRIQLEAANFGTRPLAGTLTIAAGGEGRETPLSLGAGETRRVALAIPDGDAPITATLSGDALAFDNAVTLLPTRPRDIRVALDVSNESLREPIEAALAATDRVRIFGGAREHLPPSPPGSGAGGEHLPPSPSGRGAGGEGLSDLRITDRTITAPLSGSWTLELRRGTDPVALGGPFLVNTTHPLVEGVSLGGVVWGSARGTMPGTPVISAGNTSLVTDEDTGDGGHLLRMSLTPELSTLQRTPAWPALVWNLVEWRSRSVAGFRDANVRVGALAPFTSPRGVEDLEIVAPDGTRRTQGVPGGSLMIRASQPGVWTVEAGAESFRFAANPIAPDESNVSAAATGTYGSWSTEPEPGETNRDLAWVALLVALAVLLGHQRLVAREAA